MATTNKTKLRKTPMAQAALTLVMNFGRSNTDTSPIQKEVAWKDLIKQFSVPDLRRGRLSFADYLALDKNDIAEKKIRDQEKNGPYFIAAGFSKPDTRNAADVAFLSAFTGDIDTGQIDKAFIQNALSGYKYLAYSSYSHSPNAPMWRFVILYSRDVTVEDHEKVYAYLQQVFGNQLDKRCKTATQLWYTPACPPDAGAYFEFFTGEGSPLDPDLIPVVGPVRPTKATALVVPVAPAKTPIKSLSVNQLERLKNALAMIPADDRDTWIRVGLALKHDLGAETGFEAWRDWSMTSAKFDEDAIEATWNSFKNPSGREVVTLGTVFYMAKEFGWHDTQREMPTQLQELADTHFVAFEGSKCWVFKEDYEPELKRNVLTRIGMEPFCNFYCNQKMAVPHGESVKMVSIGGLWLEHPGRRTFHKVVFMPGMPTPDGCYNLWRGFAVAPAPGSWNLLHHHILEVICAGDAVCAEYLLNWMAFAIQHPERLGEVAVVLQGERGTGKGKLAYFLCLLFGEHSIQITQTRHLIGNFNAHLRSCMFLFVDEAIWAGDKQGENVLKGLITESTIQIERKGVDVFTSPNRLHIMMASNNDWVVPAGNRERRYFVLRVSDKHIQDHPYFAAIDDQMLKHGGLAAMMHDLMSRDLSSFDIRKFPWTDALEEQVLRTLDPATQWWLDYLGQEFACWEFPVRQTLSELFAQANGTFNGKSSETKLGMFLSKVIPGGVKKVNHSHSIGTSPKLCYQLPPQEECRKALMKHLGLKKDPWV